MLFRTIYVEKSKLQNSVLLFDGGLQCLHRLGFEPHDDPSISKDKLQCKRISSSVVNACIKAVDQRITSINSDDHENTVLTPSGPSNSLNSKESIGFEFYVPEPGQNEEPAHRPQDDEKEDSMTENEMLWEQYLSEFGKPDRAELFMNWAKRKGKAIKFKVEQFLCI